LNFGHVLQKLRITGLNPERAFNKYCGLVKVSGMFGASGLISELNNRLILQGPDLNTGTFLSRWRTNFRINFTFFNRGWLTRRTRDQQKGQQAGKK
jgi:hypothetical protein